MRFLLILIASTFLFTGQAYSNEIAGSEKTLLKVNTSKHVSEEPIDYSTTNDFDAFVSSSHLRRNQLTQYRPFVFFNVVKIPADTATSALHKPEYIIKSYHHPIPIGLQLLFPQHYFW